MNKRRIFGWVFLIVGYAVILGFCAWIVVIKPPPGISANRGVIALALGAGAIAILGAFMTPWMRAGIFKDFREDP